MSDDNGEAELKAMEEQIQDLAQAQPTAAAVEEPTPEPAAAPQPPETQAPATEPVAQNTAPEKTDAADPMERARRKGLDTPEALARSLASLEDEFHRRNQAGHPGYRDIPNGNPTPQPQSPPPNWNPQPQAPGYGYPPPPPDLKRLAQQFDMDPDDFEKIARVNAALTQAAIRQERTRWESEMSGIRRQTERSAEFAELMQDPAFTDPRVQAEMREVLKDGSLFQRGGRVYTAALQIAVGNLYRKQLQQGNTNGNASPQNMPPVTAGGGNGSATNGAPKITEKEFARWTPAQMEAFINSNGKVVPKR